MPCSFDREDRWEDEPVPEIAINEAVPHADLEHLGMPVASLRGCHGSERIFALNDLEGSIRVAVAQSVTGSGNYEHVIIHQGIFERSVICSITTDRPLLLTSRAVR